MRTEYPLDRTRLPLLLAIISHRYDPFPLPSRLPLGCTLISGKSSSLWPHLDNSSLYSPFSFKTPQFCLRNIFRAPQEFRTFRTFRTFRSASASSASAGRGPREVATQHQAKRRDGPSSPGQLPQTSPHAPVRASCPSGGHE